MLKWCLLFPLFVLGLIVEAPHFQDVEAYLDEETWTLLDIDDTLLVPVQMLGCDEWFTFRLRKRLQEGLSATEALEKGLAEWEAIRHLSQMEMVEPGTDRIIRKWQERGYRIMGLTTQGLALATRTVQQLQGQGIDLERSAPLAGDHFFTQDAHGVLFRHGVLFTSGTHKGEALFRLIAASEKKPKKILFLNDKLSHLREVEAEAEKRGIPFVGLRYSFSDRRKAAFSPEIAEFQFTHSTFSHLLSDEEAKQQIASFQNL